ncbi:MAG: pilus assembly protein CpaC, partial [Planctomycetota bacterium]
MRGFHHSVQVAAMLLALSSSSGLFCGTRHAVAQPPEPTSAVNDVAVPITSSRTQVELVEKFTKVLETKNRIVRVNGFDPLILNVMALSEHRISVTALLQGMTSFIITDETGANFTAEVFVKGDARALQMLIDRKFPNASVEVFKVQEAVALRGWVTQSEHITQIVEFAEQYYPKVLNHMKVGGVQQVLLKVKVMEAQRSLIRELGMNFTYLSRSGYVNSAPGALNTLGTVTYSPLAFTSTNSPDVTGSFGIVGNNSIFNSYISALHNEALLKVLAEPEMVATNGRPATMLSGGEFPILVPQSLGTVSIQWREFGVRLEAVPFVLGGGALRLDLQPEVSERDFSNAVTVGSTTVPGLTVRRVNTQVEMKFGQTLMLAGLISKRQTSTTHKIPVLGELPYVGAAFRR